MTETLPLPQLRIWCRKNNAWLCFRTAMGDRYFVNPAGYFVELPDGTLSPITARVAFPLVNCYPAVCIGDLQLQSGFGSPSYFVCAPKDGNLTGKPRPMQLSILRQEALSILPGASKLSQPEQYLAIRVLEAGLMTEDKIEQLIEQIPAGQTLGRQMILLELTRWETLLGACLDTRVPSSFDPPASRRAFTLREWELAGEILIAMGKITRTNLEYALAIKREGNRAIGEILTALGACSQNDVDNCLSVQRNLRTRDNDVEFLGNLLVRRGIISASALEQLLAHQQVGHQSLAEVLMDNGICSPADIQQYQQETRINTFQSQLDDNNLANWLVLKGKVSQAKIAQAYHLQGRGKQVLGQMVLSMGLCSLEDLEKTLAEQQDLRPESDLESRIGKLLVRKGKVNQNQLEQALSLQSRGRRALGQILMAVGGCSRESVNKAIDLQQQWRDRVEKDEDRLGEVLIRRGFLTEDHLEQAMRRHEKSNQPIGRILVEQGWCTPEEIVASLLMRDYKRQCDLLAFIQSNAEMPDQTEQTEVLQPTWISPAPEF